MRKILLFTGALLLLFMQGYAQEKIVSGKVTSSEDGSAAPGVSVLVKGAAIGTSTDNEGNYSLSVPSGSNTLVFSFIGYKSTEVEVGTRTIVDVQLDPDITQLSEVVVVGYGTQIKQDLTGNIAQIKGDEIKNVPVPNFAQALQGRAAGVFVESESGRVGGGIKVRIRGATSITGGNGPLYVVDGIPINQGSLSGNSLADINFNDVESFEILKDASAAAIYGSRAANGVVLITTKKGKEGKTKVNVNLSYGTNKPTNLRGFLDSKEYVDFFLEAAENGARYFWNRQNDIATSPEWGYTSEQEVVDDWTASMEGRLDRYSGYSDWRTLETNTNWEKQAFQDALVKNAEVTASGGTDKTKFYVSGAYTNQDGILIGNNFKRFSSRINLDHKASEVFSFGMNFSLARTFGTRVADDNAFETPMQLVALAPITPVRNEAGELYDRPTTTYYNGLITYEDGKYESTTFRNLAGLYGVLNLAKGLTFRSEFAVDVLSQNDDQFYGSKTNTGQSTSGFGQSDWLRTVNYNTNNFFNLSKTLNSVHNIDATVGMSFQESTSDDSRVTGQEFPTDNLKKLESAGTITGGRSRVNQFSFLSYFARINYKLNDKYLLTLSGRVDGSSRFGTDNRYGFFPAASAGWIITNEEFLSQNGILDFLKLRASYGIVGNADIGDYQHFGLWKSPKYNGTSAFSPEQLVNPNLGWEKTAQMDIGIDFGIFNNRLTGEIDYYNKRTDALLYDIPVPGTSGYPDLTSNVGEMENKGFEVALNSVNIDKNNFTWESSFNFARNVNTLTKLDGDQTEIPGNDGRYLNSLVVGESIGVFYGPKYAGVDPANGDALYFTEEGTTTNDYNLASNYVVGNPNPDFIAGLSNTVRFKGFELSFLFQGVFGNEILNGAGGFMSANGDWFDNQTRDQLGRWQNPGDRTMVPQARWNWSGTIPNGIAASSRYVYDGTYVRLKTATLAYDVTSSVLSRINLSSLKIYITAQNLLTITDYPGWDPEVNADYRSGNINQGSDFYSAPQIKSLIIGLNIGF